MNERIKELIEANGLTLHGDIEHFAALVEAAARADERDRACAFMRQMHDAYSMASYPPKEKL